jgi:hypothetical protein
MENQERRTLIFRDSSLRHGFIQAPNIVIRDGSLSVNAKVLYLLLLSYAWQDGECFPGHKRLADNMGVKRTTIWRSLSELKSRRLISWARLGQGKTNIYYIEALSDGYSVKQIFDKAGALA